MKVKELIEKLKSFDEENTVYCLFPEDNPLTTGVNIETVFELKGVGEKVDGVFIKEG